MQRYFFTMGSEGHPYSGGWVEVYAESRSAAIEAYSIFHPKKNGCVNCAFIYSEAEFRKTSMFLYGNFGKRCMECIRVERSFCYAEVDE